LKKKQDWIVLCVIALVAAVLLAGTNFVTKDRIERIALMEQNASRIAALPDALVFEEVQEEPIDGIDSCYLGTKQDGTEVGYVVQTTVKGYGGEIEVMLGVDMQGVVTGMTAGGSNFSETAGLGTRVREEAFTSTFIGLTSTPIANENVETLSGATVSSSAVIGGTAVAYDHAASHLNAQ